MIVWVVMKSSDLLLCFILRGDKRGEQKKGGLNQWRRSKGRLWFLIIQRFCGIRDAVGDGDLGEGATGCS